MRLRDEKINHLSHIILNGLLKKDIAVLLDDKIKAIKEIRRVIIQELRIDEEIDEIVRGKLQSYSRRIPEGSPEWEVMYRKFFQEEMGKRSRGS
ncbi:MAG: DUF507 family protein [Nitrospirae bacterium]|jgi:hypothetical protein|nr:DUF507 family protein [Nitrospirota bacterium]